MRILLDTHFLLWWIAGARELGDNARTIIANPENLIFYSAASLWELRIKEGTGKLELPEDFFSALSQEAFEALAVTARHTEGLRKLPFHHRDPFDRMLIAQARLENLTLLTRDQVVTLYDVQSMLA
ncbi:MAG: type II toxin-antitoxin system VapC family toxin [Candidatus Eremiobacteraeota bacterium]|nr:type II toxin-antitoxin system VapC family toxin [Candidatus Eremiobacteraeota bacterium]MCW5871516.1 type II toxin-antitoxin system VapC family toxin [Candidatus Eremiobacteraeota bacterium]